MVMAGIRYDCLTKRNDYVRHRRQQRFNYGTMSDNGGPVTCFHWRLWSAAFGDTTDKSKTAIHPRQDANHVSERLFGLIPTQRGHGGCQ